MGVSPTPDINCFAGSPYLGGDGNWHCVGDVVPPATQLQLRRMNLPPFIKMQMMGSASNPIKTGGDVTPPTGGGLPVKNCLRHQAPPNYTYVFNPANGACILTPLANAAILQAQLNSQAAASAGAQTVTGDSAGSIFDGGGISQIISEHPVLALAAVAGIAYMFAGRGMKPKSREVVSTTRF